MKRFLAVFILIAAMLTATMLTMPAFAETVTQDGLEITLTTDKDIYDVGEAINAQLSVRNTTDVPIRNIRTKISVPDGYALVNQNEMTIDELLPNKARVLSSDFVNASTEAPVIPKTGDDANIGLWIGLMLASVAALCVLSSKKRMMNRFLSLFLCMVILGSLLPSAWSAQAKIIDKTANVYKYVTASNQLVRIQGSVVYAFDDGEAENPPAEVNDFEYEIVNGKCRITGYTGQDENVVIPDTIEGCPVSTIETNAFEGMTFIKTIHVPDTVYSITQSAFSGCTGLTGITLPRTLTWLGNHVFENCASLSFVVFPTDTELHIGTGAFENCSALTNVTLPNSVTQIGNFAFSSCEQLNKVTIVAGDAEVAIDEAAFSYCPNLERIDIPKNVASIADRVFEDSENVTIYSEKGSVAQEYAEVNGIPFVDVDDCDNQPSTDGELTYSVLQNGNIEINGYTGSDTSIIIPTVIDGYIVEKIGESAFEDNGNIISVVISNGIKTIGYSAFKNCYNLLDVDIPESVSKIESSAFMRCFKLESVVIPKNVSVIDFHTFANCENLASVTIPNGVISINTCAFEGCKKLKNIELPSTVSEIGRYVFSYTGLESIKIPEGIQYIGEELLMGCSSLKDVELPNTIISIGPRAFKDCYQLANINLPDSLTSIDAAAFYGCKALSSIRIPSGVDRLGSSLFWYCSNLSSIVIPSSVIGINNDPFKYCTNLVIYGQVGSYAETYANENNIPFVAIDFDSLPTLDMSAATLNKTTFAPGETITITGIKVKNANKVHFSGNNGYIGTQDITVTASSAYQEVSAVTFTLPTSTELRNDYYISVTPYMDNLAGTIDTATLTYVVSNTITPPVIGDVRWNAELINTQEIKVSVASGTPDAGKDYLFIAESMSGVHHFATIDAGETSVTFSIKGLQMPRAAKYSFFVLPSDVTLSTENREEYFIKDAVIPLFIGNMITGVRSGTESVMDTHTLQVGQDVAFDWDGCYGVDNTQIVVMVNDTVVLNTVRNSDGPETIALTRSSLQPVHGDKITITVTVQPTDTEAISMLAASGFETSVSSTWSGTFEEGNLFEIRELKFDVDQYAFVALGKELAKPDSDYTVHFMRAVNLIDSNAVYISNKSESIGIVHTAKPLYVTQEIPGTVKIVFSGEIPPLEDYTLHFPAGSLQDTKTLAINLEDVTCSFFSGTNGYMGTYEQHNSIEYGKQLPLVDNFYRCFIAKHSSANKMFIMQVPEENDNKIFSYYCYFMRSQNMQDELKWTVLSAYDPDCTRYMSINPRNNGDAEEYHIVIEQTDNGDAGTFKFSAYIPYKDVSLESDDMVEIYLPDAQLWSWLSEADIQRNTWMNTYTLYTATTMFPAIYKEKCSKYKYFYCDMDVWEFIYREWARLDGAAGESFPTIPEIIYLETPSQFSPNKDGDLLLTISHETQHSLWYTNIRISSFFNEVMSEYIAAYSMDYYNELSSTSFRRTKHGAVSDLKVYSLEQLYAGLTKRTLGNYGMYYWFGQFLEDRIGQNGINSILSRLKSYSESHGETEDLERTKSAILEVFNNQGHNIASFAGEMNSIMSEFKYWIDSNSVSSN